MNITKNDYKFFKYAKNISELSDYNGVSIGSVVVYKNSVISTGFNSKKSHPTQSKYNKLRYEGYGLPKLHAEIKALLHIKYLNINWGKTKIFVYREYKNGKLALARPCASCFQLIKDMNIKHIYYTSEDGYCYEKIF